MGDRPGHFSHTIGQYVHTPFCGNIKKWMMQPDAALSKDPKRLSVIMADDDEFAIDLMSEAFERVTMPAELTAVHNGQELIDYLNQHCAERDGFKPVLILLDLNMSGKDGRQALREIRSNPDLANIPIVVMSSSNEEQDLRNSYKWGCNAFIKKPELFQDLVKIVDTLKHFWFEAVLRPDQCVSG